MTDIRVWVESCGLTEQNTPDFLISCTLGEIEELRKSAKKAEKITDPEFLEEIPDSVIFLLNLLPPESIPRIAHATHQLIMARTVTVDTIVSFGKSLQQKAMDKPEKRESAVRETAIRTIASVFAFALQNKLDPIALTQIKHQYNLLRYEPRIFNKIGRAECKAREEKLEMKKKVLYPRYESYTKEHVTHILAA